VFVSVGDGTILRMELTIVESGVPDRRPIDTRSAEVLGYATADGLV